MGGPEMAPHPPQRSSRPGAAVARLDPPRSSRPGAAVARLDPPRSSRPGAAVARQTEFDYPRAMDGLNTYRSLHRGRARGLAEAFHVAELDVYRRLFDLIAIGRRRAATA